MSSYECLTSKAALLKEVPLDVPEDLSAVTQRQIWNPGLFLVSPSGQKVFMPGLKSNTLIYQRC